MQDLTVKYLGTILLARLFRFLPIDVASAVGARIARREAIRAIKAKRKWVTRLDYNFQELESVGDITGREQRIVQYAEHVGRLYAEYPVLHKIAMNRFTVHGSEYLKNLSGPAVFVSAHTGQWELVFEVMRRSNIAVTCLYDPIPDKALLRMAMEVRRHLCPEARGNRFIPASSSAARELVNCLKRGENLVIYIDEDKDGLVWSPSLGRTVPFAGNRVMAARLAVKFQVPVIPIHIQRKLGAEFEAFVEPPIEVDTDEFGDSSATELAMCLDEVLGHWLKEDYSHWYWLANLNLEKKFPEKLFKK